MTLHQLGEVEQARSYFDQLVEEFDENHVAGQPSIRAEAAKVLGIEEPLEEPEETATE
jgi:hypothetical protein